MERQFKKQEVQLRGREDTERVSKKKDKLKGELLRLSATRSQLTENLSTQKTQLEQMRKLALSAILNIQLFKVSNLPALAPGSQFRLAFQLGDSKHEGKISTMYTPFFSDAEELARQMQFALPVANAAAQEVTVFLLLADKEQVKRYRHRRNEGYTDVPTEGIDNTLKVLGSYAVSLKEVRACVGGVFYSRDGLKLKPHGRVTCTFSLEGLVSVEDDNTLQNDGLLLREKQERDLEVLNQQMTRVSHDLFRLQQAEHALFSGQSAPPSRSHSARATPRRRPATLDPRSTPQTARVAEGRRGSNKGSATRRLLPEKNQEGIADPRSERAREGAGSRGSADSEGETEDGRSDALSTRGNGKLQLPPGPGRHAANSPALVFARLEAMSNAKLTKRPPNSIFPESHSISTQMNALALLDPIDTEEPGPEIGASRRRRRNATGKRPTLTTLATLMRLTPTPTPTLQASARAVAQLAPMRCNKEASPNNCDYSMRVSSYSVCIRS